jgi:hypothetical protein
MTGLSEIIELNRGQKVSEIDPFTEGRYKQFVRHLPPAARDCWMSAATQAGAAM